MQTDSNPIRLKIISDGTRAGTKVVDTVTGREVDGMVAVMIEADVDDAGRPLTALIAFEPVGIDIVSPLCRKDSNPRAIPDKFRITANPLPNNAALSLLDLNLFDAATGAGFADCVSLQFMFPGPNPDIPEEEIANDPRYNTGPPRLYIETVSERHADESEWAIRSPAEQGDASGPTFITDNEE